MIIIKARYRFLSKFDKQLKKTENLNFIVNN